MFLQGKRHGVVELRQAFRSMDRTGYTQINHADLKTLLHHENIKVGDEEMHQLFSRYDTDQDGLISWTDVELRIIPPDFPTVVRARSSQINCPWKPFP
jgi:Ca2+-binding EF-hand superfamily protein